MKVEKLGQNPTTSRQQRWNPSQLRAFLARVETDNYRLHKGKIKVKRPAQLLALFYWNAIRSARVIERHDPELQFGGYRDLYNHFKSVLVGAIRIEMTLAESDCLDLPSREKIADIIYSFARFGRFYYYKRNLDPVEVVLGDAESALQRYRWLGREEKAQKVQRFMDELRQKERLPAEKSNEQLILDYHKKKMDEWIGGFERNPVKFGINYKINCLGFDESVHNGNYVSVYKICLYTAEKLKFIRKSKEAGEWLAKADRMDKLASLVFPQDRI